MDDTPELEPAEEVEGRPLIKLEIERGDLDTAFENSGTGEMECFLDLQTGVIEVLIDPAYCGMDEEYEEAKSKIDQDPDRYLPIEPISSHEAYGFMEDFVDNEVEGQAQKDLWERLKRRKPFRQFEDGICDYPGLRERWFEYHDARVRDYAKDWFAMNGVDAVFVPHKPSAD